MIRLFLNLCKHFHSIKNLSEIEIHTSMQDKLITEIKSCPVCGAPGHAFHKDGFYQRDFICYEKEQPVYHRITVFCTECSSCGHSHALQLSVIVPYSSYSIGFLTHVIYATITKQFPTIEELCHHFQISISTYYRIYKRFLTDSILMKQLVDLSSFFEVSVRNFHAVLQLFYEDCGRSFLQPCVRLCPKISLANLPTDNSRYLDHSIHTAGLVP